MNPGTSTSKNKMERNLGFVQKEVLVMKIVQIRGKDVPKVR